MLLYLQQAGVGGCTVEEAGTQDIEQTEPAIFVQDKWQPRRNLTIEYGLRWEAQDKPERITPANEVFFAPFIGKTVTTAAGTQTFPSDGEIPDDYEMWQPRLGISWDPTATASRWCAPPPASSTRRLPGSQPRLHALDQRQPSARRCSATAR